MMIKSALKRGGIVAACLLLALTGCDSGPKRYSISGKVTFKDKPVPAGALRFIPSEPTIMTSGGAIITDGKYSIPSEQGLLAGSYKVAVSMPDPNVKVVDEETPGSGPVAKEMIPEKYNSDTKTVLTIVVKPEGPFEFPFDLK